MTNTRKRRPTSRAAAKRGRQREEAHLYKAGLLRDFVAKHGWRPIEQSSRGAAVRIRDVDLGQWVTGRRHAYRKGTISDTIVRILEDIPGWSWNPVRDRQVAVIDNLRSFAHRHGWDALHVDTEIDGVVLSDWCKARRAEHRKGVLPGWLEKALEAIPGWTWTIWEDSYRMWLRAVRDHVQRHGWEDVRLQTVARNGAKIGQWLGSVRERYREDRLPAWVAAELEAIPGFSWEPLRDRHARKVDALRRFVARYGWDAVTRSCVVDGAEIGAWLVMCRDRYNAGSISQHLVDELEAIPGWKWERRYRARR